MAISPSRQVVKNGSVESANLLLRVEPIDDGEIHKPVVDRSIQTIEPMSSILGSEKSTSAPSRSVHCTLGMGCNADGREGTACGCRH